MSKKPAAPTSAPAATDELNPSLDAMLSTLSMARKGGDAAQAAAGETQRCGLIAIVGRPNVGKSTLLNALVGQKVSITSRKAQTTRHRITGIRSDGDTQFVFVDTPGFQTRHTVRGTAALNRNLNKTVQATLSDVDVVLFLVEAGRYGPDDAQVLAMLPKDKPVILVANKLDMVNRREDLFPWLQTMQDGLSKAVTDVRRSSDYVSHASGEIGEDPNGIPNNLMPFISQVAVGKRDKLSVFGNDYSTHDGTGVRDYIHVVDLARGHVKALQYLQHHTGIEAINLGTGSGYSVLDMVKAFSDVNQVAVPYQLAARRPGDIAVCYAEPNKAKTMLGWQAEKTLEDMVRDSWRWQSNNPDGYKS